MSFVDPAGRHRAITRSCQAAFRQLADRIPDEIPVILESPVTEGSIESEIEQARLALPPAGA